VTAVVLGEALNVKQYQSRQPEPASESLKDFFDLQTPTNEPIASRARTPANEVAIGNQTPTNDRLTKTTHLLEALRQAAYAGRIKFRAIKGYGPLADGLTDIDPIHFYHEVAFNCPGMRFPPPQKRRRRFGVVFIWTGNSLRHC
jgi:hypothetical protein